MENDNQLSRLQAEIKRLKALLKAHGIDEQARVDHLGDQASVEIVSSLSTEKKNRLFRELFEGRSDVFAIRWESASSGRSGYAPACANEWRPGICQKPRIKCSECNHRQFVPLTDEAIYRHLAGEQTIGSYPLRPDNTCCYLAIDFDASSWQDDALAYVNSCEALEIPAALEISRSRQGAHVWIFFDRQIPAFEARQLGTALISYTCARTRQLELSSYDRLFPSQDVMPKGGFGNLIALPLQKLRRDEKCSVFVDQQWRPFPDQWAYLQGLKRVSPDKVSAAIHRASKGHHPLDLSFIDGEDYSKPWQRGALETLDPDIPMPASIDAIIANMCVSRR